LLYDAQEVPVGDDQRQHIEITRDIATRFNHRFGDTFVLPRAVHPKMGARVMDLQDPTSKMSKSAHSDAGIIYMLDDNETIMRKFKRAVTDSDNDIRYDPATKPGIANLLEILSAATATPVESLLGQYQQYGPLKADAGDAVISLLEPIRLRYKALMSDPAELTRLLAIGDSRARTIAAATLARAHSAIGLLPKA
ncbi:MAG: tryptophan--tRNA ligase, partial [Ilumatobacteraceae bacterium]|nr:tryptophan--tRNA ligase [Ilumatobacteraceae bacterium]